MADYNKIYEFMTQYLDFLGETEKKEQEKMNALLSNDLKRIENIMNEYQFVITKMQSYEDKRIALFDEENLSGMTFTEAVDTFSGEERKNLRILYSKVSSSVENIKQFNKKSLEIANLNIKIMEEVNLDAGSVSDANCYNKNGVQDNGIKRNSMFNTTI